MITIMDTSKTLDVLANDNTNGLGQIHPINCIVTEELNGVYEAEISVPADDKHFSDLAVGGILRIPVSETDEQLFRINAITKPMESVCNVECSHITYDLNKVAVRPFTATGAVATKNGMLSNIIGTYPFTMTTDITNTTSKFTLDIPRSFRECLGGYEGSLLDVFRGEYEYDNLTVKMLARRGADNGVRISYGKNLTSFVQDTNMDNVYTSVLGYAVVNEQTYTGNVYHKITATYPKVLIVDFSSDYETEATPTTAELTAKARAYAEANDIEVPKVNMEISFVPLYQTEEYKNIAPLERVSLGDTVHVYFDKLGVEASARVIKTEWNVLLGRYESVELGDAKANLNTIIQETAQQTKTEVTDSQGFLESQMNQMASLIINGLGLHRTLVPAEGGGYRIYLHNKENLVDSDTQYIFTAEGFLVSTDYGQTWNAGFDSQGNAVLNSLATITLKALEINGSTINGTVINGSMINGATIVFGTDSTKKVTASGDSNGVQFVGNGQIKFDSTNTFGVNNYDSNGVLRNRFSVTNTGGLTSETYDANEETINSLHMRDDYVQIRNVYTASNGKKYRNLFHTKVVGTVGSASFSDAVSLEHGLDSGTMYSSLTLTDKQIILWGDDVYIYANSGTGKIYLVGDSVYFNGTKKW